MYTLSRHDILSYDSDSISTSLRLIMKKMLTLSASIALISTLSGCATIMGGTSQSLTVETKPSGAVCRLTNDEGSWVTGKTTSSISIDKDCDPVTIVCRLPQHEDSLHKHESKFTGETFGNIILGGPIGVAIDAASGANCKYASPVVITLHRQKVKDGSLVSE